MPRLQTVQELLKEQEEYTLPEGCKQTWIRFLREELSNTYISKDTYYPYIDIPSERLGSQRKRAALVKFFEELLTEAGHDYISLEYSCDEHGNPTPLIQRLQFRVHPDAV